MPRSPQPRRLLPPDGAFAVLLTASEQPVGLEPYVTHADALQGAERLANRIARRHHRRPATYWQTYDAASGRYVSLAAPRERIDVVPLPLRLWSAAWPTPSHVMTVAPNGVRTFAPLAAPTAKARDD